MDKQYKKTDELCSVYREKMVELFDNDLSLNSDKLIIKHLEICQECQSYLKSLVIIKNRLNGAPTKNLKPDSHILKNVIAYKHLKQGLRNTRSETVWVRIRDLLEYRIPVYQAVGGFVVLFMFFMFISDSIVSHGYQTYIKDQSGDYEGITSTELYLVDSLSISKPERGQNAKEDSVLMSFLVPTM